VPLTQQQRDNILFFAKSNEWTGVPYILGGDYGPGKLRGPQLRRFVLRHEILLAVGDKLSGSIGGRPIP
jgi:hypothetical protein